MENNKKVTCRNIKGETRDFPLSELKFGASVYGVIIKDNKILLSKQWDGYDYPGGGINIGERLHEALKREAWEEVGLKVLNYSVLDCQDNFYLSIKDEPKHGFLIYCVIDEFSGEPSIDNLVEKESDYISGFEWIDIEKIEKIKFNNNIDNNKLIERANKFLSDNLK